MGAVRQQIGPFAAPDVIHWAPGLPKTRSGKIMRRVLRKIASQVGWGGAGGRGVGRAPCAAQDTTGWSQLPPPPTNTTHLLPHLLRQEEDQLGDVSTLADPSVVAQLIELRGK